MDNQNEKKTNQTLLREAFQYYKPNEEQRADMDLLRDSAANFAKDIERVIPEGPDRTYLLRKFREVAMWANVAITRHPNGTPRE